MENSNQDMRDHQASNIADYLRLNAKKHPEKPALLYPERITYKELDKEVDRYSFGLESAGIKNGTKTILMVPVGAGFLIYTFALLRIGAIPVMIDPGMGINAMLNALAEIKADAFIGIPKAHLLRLIRPSVFNTIKTRITTRFSLFFGAQGQRKFLTDDGKEYQGCPVDGNKITGIFFTSGSTGPAKGVVYTSAMLNTQIGLTKTQFNVGQDDIDLCTSHLLGLFAICHGISSVIADIDMSHPATLNPARIINNIRDFNCTQMFGSPMVLKKLALYGNENSIRLPSLKRIISAGAPVHRKILISFGQLVTIEAVIHTPYGATEALPVTDIIASELPLKESDKPENECGICIGYPVKDLDVRIIKITDSPINSWNDAICLPVNEIGEIAVKGPWVSTEYYNKPEANKLAKIQDLKNHGVWHRMGDLGRTDENGMLWYYGRKSQRVITITGTLFTIPCEAVFNGHPKVVRSAMIGLPSEIPGIKKPVICIELGKGIRPSKKLIMELLELGRSNTLTQDISKILFFKKFPVDPRHNAKIFREKLTEWAIKSIK